MKHCPTCQTKFDGDEAYCPHDGTPLVAGPEHQPGRLTGSSLNGAINLGAFLYADHLGERYRGRLLGNNQDVRVTVSYRRIAEDVIDAAYEKATQLDSPLPSQVLSLYSLHSDAERVYLIEQSPSYDTLERHLQKQGPMDWRQALSLTLRCARILRWLADRDLPHRMLHPRSIFVGDDDSLEIGEWLLGLITFPPPSLDENTPPGAIPIYPGFTAPEWVDNADDADVEQAAVFSAGAIFCAAIGHPLFDEHSLDDTSLRAWFDDDARGAPSLELDDDAPEALAHLAKSMVAPSPSKRFDSLQAAMVALSSLLDKSPDEIAPELAPADTSIFDTRPSPTSSDASNEADSADEPAPSKGSKKETMMGLPAQAVTAEQAASESTVQGHIPRVITDDPDDDADSDAVPKQGPTTADSTMERIDTKELHESDLQDDEPKEKSQKKTMLMGVVSVPDKDDGDDDGKKSSDDRAKDATTDDDDVAGRTAQHFLGDQSDGESDDTVTDSADDDPSEGDRNASDEKDKKDGESDEITADTTEEDDDTPSVIIDESMDDDEQDDDEQDDDEQDDDEQDDDEQDDDEQDDDEQDDEQDDEEDDGNNSSKSIIIDPELSDDEQDDDEQDDEEDDDEQQNEQDDEQDDESQSDDDEDSSPGMEIGFVQAASNDGGQPTDAFFARSTEDAWEQDLVRESHERSQKIEKWTRTIMIAAGVLIVIGAYVLFQGVYGPEDEQEIEDEAVAVDDTLEPHELIVIENRFNRALERDEILQPRERSALVALKDLRRHADESVYEDARKRFVEAADKKSRLAEEQGYLLEARNLSGHASTESDGDQALRERAERIQELYLASQEEGQDASDEEPAEQEDADTADEDGDPADGDRDDSAGPDSETASDDTSQTGTTTTSPRSTGSGELDTLLQEAQQAKSDRDNARAREKFTAVLEIDPSHVEANAGLGEIHFNEGEHAQAIQYHRRAVQGAPDNVDYKLRLGMSHYRLQEDQEAIEIWQQVLELDPGNTRAELYIERAERRLN